MILNLIYCTIYCLLCLLVNILYFNISWNKAIKNIHFWKVSLVL